MKWNDELRFWMLNLIVGTAWAIGIVTAAIIIGVALAALFH